MDEFFSTIERQAERYLTVRKAKKAAEAAARKPRTFWGEVKGWIDAIVFAVFAVLLINQYLFQLFVIPSPSMEKTLLTGDRVFVNKTSYGIELYPGGKKILTRHRQPERDQIITFYNPNYASRGPVYDVLTQILYMGTFSLVNIDVDDAGNPRERLYVKRAVGMPGDVINFSNGDVMINPAGTDGFINESVFRSDNGLAQGPNRLVDPDIYDGLKAYAALTAYEDKGLTSAPQHLLNSYQSVKNYSGLGDDYQVHSSKYRTERLLDPSDFSARSDAARYERGIYVPAHHVLPLGDNRDNSFDGRYFGPVDTDDINGRVIARFWPLNRMKVLTDD